MSKQFKSTKWKTTFSFGELLLWLLFSFFVRTSYLNFWMLYLLLHFCFVRNVLDVVTRSAPIACTTDFNLTFYFFSSIVHVVVSRQFRLSATDNTPLWDSKKWGKTGHYVHWMTQPRMWNAKCEFFPYACLANQPGKAPAARLPPESSPMDFPVLSGQVTPSCNIILLQFHPAIVYFSVPLHDTADYALLNLAGM